MAINDCPPYLSFRFFFLFFLTLDSKGDYVNWGTNWEGMKILPGWCGHRWRAHLLFMDKNMGIGKAKQEHLPLAKTFMSCFPFPFSGPSISDLCLAQCSVLTASCFHWRTSLDFKIIFQVSYSKQLDNLKSTSFMWWS